MIQFRLPAINEKELTTVLEIGFQGGERQDYDLLECDAM
jgi:hypothetical protein